MSAERSNHEKTKTDLSNELESVLKAAIAAPVSSKEHVASEITLAMCNVIEAVFIHGLRDPFFLKGSRYAKYPEPNFWPFVSKYTHRGITNQIKSLNQIRTEIGRCRAWIRIVMNESSLEHYVLLLLSEKKSLSQFYNDFAFLRDCERVERLNGVLKGLSRLPINAATNSSFLNTWTPSPLILAGLVSGKPIKIGSMTIIRKLSKDCDEVGTNALDIPSSTSISPLRSQRTRKISVKMGGGSDDECSSVYSHPSLLDKNECPLMSTTPISDSSAMKDSSDNFQPLIVSRRTRGPRKLSRSSNDSNPKLSSLASKDGDGSNRNSPTDRNGDDSRDSTFLKPDDRDRFVSDRLNFLPEDVLLNALLATSVENRAEQSKQESAHESEEVHDNSIHNHKPAEESAYDVVFGSVPSRSPILMPQMDKIGLNMEDNTEEESGEELEHKENHGDELPDADINDELSDSEMKEKSNTQEESEENLQEVEPQLHKEVVFDLEPHDDGLTQEMKKENFDEGNNSSGSPNESTNQSTLTYNQEPIDIQNMHFPVTNESVLLGTSLHDELTNALPFTSLDDSASSNTLMGKGWAVPRSVESESNYALSSSSSTDCSVGVVSFGQALRSALEQDSPENEEKPIVWTPEDSVKCDETTEKRDSNRERTVLEIFTDIPSEIGLPAQEFRCPMCRKSIGPQFGYAKYGCCYMDGLYYCSDCLSGVTNAIPSRVIHSWDWTTREVSQKGRSILGKNMESPIINILEQNDALYEHCPPLKAVKEMRERLGLAAMYLFTCRESVAGEFRNKLCTKEYIYNDIHLYSFADLENVRNGTFERQLSSWLKFAVGHVLSCTTCKQKGFYCEVCNSPEIIYPFNTATTHRCVDCGSLFHLECAQTDCPKCARRARYDTKREASDLPLD